MFYAFAFNCQVNVNVDSARWNQPQEGGNSNMIVILFLAYNHMINLENPIIIKSARPINTHLERNICYRFFSKNKHLT